MTNIILQHFNGELRELDKHSVENIQQYAKLVGADYKLITGKPFNSQLTDPCQKVHLISEEFDSYDNVLMLDIDMFAPKGMTDNVFDWTGVGLYENVQRGLHLKLITQYPHLGSIFNPYWGGAIYKMDRALRQRLRNVLSKDSTWMNVYNKPYHFEDEGIIHTLAYKAQISPIDTILDKRWCQCSFLPSPEKAKFIHIRTKITPSGPKREKIENYNDLVNRGVL